MTRPKSAKKSQKRPITHRKKRGEGPIRKAEIVAAAHELMLRDGYDRTTMRKIARKVGMSPTALYLYFPDKETLSFDVCHRAFEPLIQSSLALMTDASDAVEKLRKGIVAYMQWGLANPEQYDLIFLRRRINEQPYDHRRPLQFFTDDGEPRYNVFAFLVDGIQTLVQEGLLKEVDDIYITAETVWMACHGLVSALTAHPTAPFSSAEKLIESMSTMIINGLGIKR